MYYTKFIDNEILNTGLIHHIDMRLDSEEELDELSSKFSNQYLTTGPMGNVPEFQQLSKIAVDFAIEKSTEHYKHSFESFWDIYSSMYIESFKCGGIWGRRDSSGEFISSHNHFPFTWVFTYYIDPPEGSSGLYLTDSNTEIPIEHGLMVLFKGDLNHETRPSDFDGYRYCVSGNILPKPPAWPEVSNV
jgi:hypothetical protein